MLIGWKEALHRHRQVSNDGGQVTQRERSPGGEATPFARGEEPLGQRHQRRSEIERQRFAVRERKVGAVIERRDEFVGGGRVVVDRDITSCAPIARARSPNNVNRRHRRGAGGLRHIVLDVFAARRVTGAGHLRKIGQLVIGRDHRSVGMDRRLQSVACRVKLVDAFPILLDGVLILRKCSHESYSPFGFRVFGFAFYQATRNGVAAT